VNTLSKRGLAPGSCVHRPDNLHGSQFPKRAVWQTRAALRIIIWLTLPTTPSPQVLVYRLGFATQLCSNLYWNRPCLQHFWLDV